MAVDAVLQNETSRRKSPWPFILKAAVSIVLLWLTLRHVALKAVAAQIATVDRLALVAALFVLLAATFVAAIRWAVILQALGYPRGPRITYPLSLIGLFFGQALPAGIGGDVVRTWLACRTGLTARTAIASILGDRLAGFLAILVMVTVGLPSLHAVLLHSTLYGGLLLVLAASYVAIVAVLVLDKLPRALHRFRAVRGLAGVSADIRAALFCPLGAIVLLCGAIVQLTNIFAVFLLAHGLHIEQATLTNCLLVVPLANIAQSIPVSVAGWGVREGFFVVAFGAVGVSAPQALAVSVIFGLLVIVSSLPGAVLWLMQRTGSTEKLSQVA